MLKNISIITCLEYFTEDCSLIVDLRIWSPMGIVNANAHGRQRPLPIRSAACSSAFAVDRKTEVNFLLYFFLNSQRLSSKKSLQIENLTNIKRYLKDALLSSIFLSTFYFYFYLRFRFHMSSPIIFPHKYSCCPIFIMD